MKKALFIIRTPFQLFNALEAQKRFETCEETFLLCLYKKDVDRILMEKMISNTKWTKVKWFKLTLINRTFYPLILERFLSNLRNSDYCFFGLITNLITHCINTIHAKNNILIDDGNEILLIAQKISTFLNTKKKSDLNILAYLKGRKINYDYIDKLIIFTFFDLKNYKLKNTIIHNDYRAFKKETSTLPITQEIFFIGSNLINTYMSQEIFEKNLAKVINYFKPIYMTYILHRYEDEIYFQKLSKKLDFRIIKFDSILETALLEYKKKPIGIATFRSTALETLGYLYNPIDQTIFMINTETLLKQEQKQEFDNLYLNYKQKNISMVNLEEY